MNTGNLYLTSNYTIPCIVQWQLPDGNRLASDDVLGTSIKYFIYLNYPTYTCVKNKMLLYTVSNYSRNVHIPICKMSDTLNNLLTSLYRGMSSTKLVPQPKNTWIQYSFLLWDWKADENWMTGGALAFLQECAANVNMSTVPTKVLDR